MALDPVRRTPLPHQLLVPRRRLATGRPGRAGRRAGADRAGRHRPRRPVRRGPLRGAAEAAGLHPVIGIEIELLDPAAPDPDRVVDPAPAPATARRADAGRRDRDAGRARGRPGTGRDPSAPRLPGHREPVKEDLRGIGERARGPHLVLLARSAIGWRSLCRLVSQRQHGRHEGRARASRQALLAEHAEGLVALSGCRDGEIARRLRVGDRDGARAVAERYARLFGRGDGPAGSGFFIELSHHLLPDDDWLVAEIGGAGRRPGPAGRGHQRRPLRPSRGPRAGRRADRDPPRPDARDARPTCAAPTASRT